MLKVGCYYRFICLFLQLDEKPLKGGICLSSLCCCDETHCGCLIRVCGNSEFSFQFRLGSCCRKCLPEVILEYNSHVLYDENHTVNKWESVLTNSR